MLIEKASSDIGEFYSQGQRGARWGWGMVVVLKTNVTRTVHAVKSFLHFSLVVRNSYMHDIHCNSQTQQCMRGQCLHFLLSNIWYVTHASVGYMTVKVICFNLINNYP